MTKVEIDPSVIKNSKYPCLVYSGERIRNPDGVAQHPKTEEELAQDRLMLTIDRHLSNYWPQG